MRTYCAVFLHAIIFILVKSNNITINSSSTATIYITDLESKDEEINIDDSSLNGTEYNSSDGTLTASGCLSSIESFDKPDCVICLKTIKKMRQLSRCETMCGAVYHTSCYNQWRLQAMIARIRLNRTQSTSAKSDTLKLCPNCNNPEYNGTNNEPFNDGNDHTIDLQQFRSTINEYKSHKIGICIFCIVFMLGLIPFFVSYYYSNIFSLLQ